MTGKESSTATTQLHATLVYLMNQWSMKANDNQLVLKIVIVTQHQQCDGNGMQQSLWKLMIFPEMKTHLYAYQITERTTSCF